MDEVQTVVNFVKTMTSKGKHPVVKLNNQIYERGVKLTSGEMEQVESQIQTRMDNMSTPQDIE